MERLVLSEHDLYAHWGVSIKTLQRWRKVGRGPRFLTIGRRVSYTLKDVEHFETYALYENRLRNAIDESLPTNVQSPNTLMNCKCPRTAQQEVIDLIAIALLRLRAVGPPPKNSPQTLTNNPTLLNNPRRPRIPKRVLGLIRARCE